MALWAIMRLQIFDEGFRTASSTIKETEKKTVYGGSHLGLGRYLHWINTLTSDNECCKNERDKRVTTGAASPVNFAHLSVIG